jgi:hypothetical protein
MNRFYQTIALAEQRRKSFVSAKPKAISKHTKVKTWMGSAKSNKGSVPATSHNGLFVRPMVPSLGLTLPERFFSLVVRITHNGLQIMGLTSLGSQTSLLQHEKSSL